MVVRCGEGCRRVIGSLRGGGVQDEAMGEGLCRVLEDESVSQW